MVTADVLLRMATANGAKAILEDRLGILREGYKADVITVDVVESHCAPLYGASSLPLFCGGSDVRDVVVDGKLVVREREVLTIDEERVLSDAKELAPTIEEEVRAIAGFG